MDEFYKFSETCATDANTEKDTTSPTDVPQDVKDAYFQLVVDFCSCVSPHWRDYIKILYSRDHATFNDQLTISDEAYTIWYIKFNYEIKKEEAEFIKKHGAQALKDKKKREAPWTT